MADTIQLQWPVAGLDKRFAIQSQAPFTTPDALNVWPRDRFQQRLRGGSRPGLTKSFSTQIHTNPVHFVGNLRWVTSADGQTYWQDDFTNANGSLSAIWSAASWLSDGMPFLADGTAYAQSVFSGDTEDKGAVRSALDLDTASSYTIDLQIPGTLDPSFPDGNGYLDIFARMNDTAPNVLTEGIRVRVNFATSQLVLTEFNAGVATDYTQALSAWSYPTPLRCQIAGNTITVTFGSASINQAVTAHTGKKMGFGIGGGTNAIRIVYSRADWFKVNYKSSTPTTVSGNRNSLVALSANSTSAIPGYYEQIPGSLTAIGTVGPDNRNNAFMQGVEMFRAETTAGARLYIVGNYVAGAQPIMEFDPTGSGALINLTASATEGGTVPLDQTCIARFMDRLYVSGGRADPHEWYACKRGQTRKWENGTSPGSAVIGSSTEAGKIAQPVRGLIAHSDDYLIFGATNSLWVLRGDPTIGGRIDKLADIGLVDAQAWARGPNNETLILSTDGLYGIAAGISAPESVSRERLPKELRDIDTANYRVMMGFDYRLRGALIAITYMPMDGAGTYYWFDWETKGFWPLRFRPGHEPTAMAFRNADAPQDKRLVIGCRDGYLRHLDEMSGADDGLVVDSHVYYGPLMLGDGLLRDGMVREIVGEPAEESGEIEATLYTGSSASGALNSTPRHRYRFRPGTNRTWRPNARGMYAFLKLSSVNGSTMAMEKLVMSRDVLGRQIL